MLRIYAHSSAMRGCILAFYFFFFFSSRRRHTRLQGDWSSDVCSSDLIDPDIFALIRSNFRGTREISGDFRAQTAANRLGAQRIEALVAQHGAATLAQYLDELLRYTERRTRAAFAEFPDGRFAAEMFMDGDRV